MRPHGYNTSRYTRQDGDDHFFGALKFLAVIIAVGGVLIGGPIGLAMACEQGGLEFWIGALIFFGIEACCVVGCLLAGAYQMLETQVNGGVYDEEAGWNETPTSNVSAKATTPTASRSRAPAPRLLCENRRPC